MYKFPKTLYAIHIEQDVNYVDWRGVNEASAHTVLELVKPITDNQAIYNIPRTKMYVILTPIRVREGHYAIVSSFCEK